LRSAGLQTELDEKTLLAIAGKTGGRYFRARDIKGLQEIYRLLDELEPAAKADGKPENRHQK